jgi:hypothetical protein
MSNDIRNNQIRCLHETGEWSYRQLAAKYGLTYQRVQQIVKNKSSYTLEKSKRIYLRKVARYLAEKNGEPVKDVYARLGVETNPDYARSRNVD